MPVPKRRTSSRKRDMRRAQHDKVVVPHVVPCSNCSAPVLPHRVCRSCGYYGGKLVLRIATDSSAKGT